MNAEIVEAIRELGQTSCWEKASVIIGGISILLTLVVLWYNHKSIKLTQQTMRQAINLHNKSDMLDYRQYLQLKVKFRYFVFGNLLNELFL